MPILALRPSRVISVFSEETKAFLKRKDAIENAVMVHFHRPAANPDFSLRINLSSTSPSILETQNAVEEVIKSTPGSHIINYTGGTKEMSIGAWLAAKENGIPSIYCDSPREFRSGGTGEIKLPVQLPELARDLDVPTILAAQGLMFERDWQHLGTTRPQIEFGKAAFSFTVEHPHEARILREVIRKHGLGVNDKPRQTDLERSINEPLPFEENEHNRPFLLAAKSAGLLNPDHGQWFLAVSRRQQQPLKQKLSRLKNIVMLLDGGAFEGYVHSCIERSTRFTGFLHGVVPKGVTERAGFGETDFLAYEPERTSLALITCKSSPPSLEHLESVLARKEKLGGRFARGILCIMSAGSRNPDDIRRQASLLGLECIFGNEIEGAFGCPPFEKPEFESFREFDKPPEKMNSVSSYPSNDKIDMEQAVNSVLKDKLEQLPSRDL